MNNKITDPLSFEEHVVLFGIKIKLQKMGYILKLEKIKKVKK